MMITLLVDDAFDASLIRHTPHADYAIIEVCFASSPLVIITLMPLTPSRRCCLLLYASFDTPLMPAIDTFFFQDAAFAAASPEFSIDIISAADTP